MVYICVGQKYVYDKIWSHQMFQRKCGESFQKLSEIGMNPDIQGKILWNHADKPFTIPWDLYCVTHVHCQVRKIWFFMTNQ